MTTFTKHLAKPENEGLEWWKLLETSTLLVLMGEGDHGKRRINAYLLIGLIGVLTSGSMLFTYLYQAFWGDETI